MEELFEALRNFYMLPQQLKEHIASGLEFFTWNPEDKPVIVGQVSRYIYYLQAGLLVIRQPGEEKSSISWVLVKGDFVVVPSSFFTQTPSKEEIIVVEPVEAIGYTHERLENACDQNAVFNKHYKLINAHYRDLEASRAKELLAMKPDERLAWLWQHHPDYFSRLSVEMICEYLGISKDQYNRYIGRR